jgi:predicted nucleic acid-binding protein
MIVLDSSAVIELLVGTANGGKVQSIIDNEVAAVSPVTINEVLIGAQGKQLSVALDFFRTAQVIPFEAEAAYVSVDIERVLRKKGKVVSKQDVFIAASCIVHQLRLLTFDKDFGNIEKLELISV